MDVGFRQLRDLPHRGDKVLVANLRAERRLRVLDIGEQAQRAVLALLLRQVAQALGETAQPLGMVSDALDRIARAFDPAGDGIERLGALPPMGKGEQDDDYAATHSHC